MARAVKPQWEASVEETAQKKWLCLSTWAFLKSPSQSWAPMQQVKATIPDSRPLEEVQEVSSTLCDKIQ